MDQEKTYLSQEKYDELQAELTFLCNERRREVAERLESAKSLGDLSENAEYHAARDEQAELEDRISELELILRQAEIVGTSLGKSHTVGIGSRVRVHKNGSKDEFVFQLVGQEEADMTLGRISHQSPLGQSLFGKKRGETVLVQTPRGEVKYKIAAIE